MRELVITEVSRPDPASYFSDPDVGFLSWETLIWRFAAEKSYWICSSLKVPHAMPVWGIWHDCAFRFCTSPKSRKAKNLQANPEAVVHLGDPEAVFSMHCHAVELTSTAAQQTFCDEFNPKYRWNFKPEDVAGGLFALTPHTAFAWASGDTPTFGDTGTRWRIEVTG